MFNPEQLINQFVIKPPSLTFKQDIETNHDAFSSKTEGKSVLVIGEAVSIGSSFIKTRLSF